MKLRTRTAWLLLPLIALTLSACNKLNDEQLRLLSLAAHTSTERAATIGAFESLIKARDDKDAQHVTEYLTAHREGLEAEAKALSDFLAAGAKGKLHDRSIRHLRILAENATARAKGWAAVQKFIHAPGADAEAWAAFVKAHGEGLQRMADALNALVKKLPEPKDDEPEDEKPKE